MFKLIVYCFLGANPIVVTPAEMYSSMEACHEAGTQIEYRLQQEHPGNSTATMCVKKETN